MEKFKTEIAAHFTEIYEGNARALVFGEGAFSAKLMMIGEAPGEQETLQGRPFVGKAGKNLDEFLELSGLKREEIYITNTVKFRPVKKSPAGRFSNRPPTKEEIALFLPWLKKEIALVKPLCVATLGNVPLRAVTGRNITIGETHGQFLDVDGLRLYPLYHPASLIYNPALRDVYLEDVKRLGEWVRENA